MKTRLIDPALLDDLARGELALQAAQPAGAEVAAHRAADLAGDTRGVAVLLGNQHALAVGPVRPFQQELDGPVR